MKTTKTEKERKLKQLSKLVYEAFCIFSEQEIFDAIRENTNSGTFGDFMDEAKKELYFSGEIIITPETVYNEYLIGDFCKENRLKIFYN